MFKKLCVYCGSNIGDRDCFRDAAAGLGKYLAQNDISLVYGGGKVGLMGVLADAALAGGGRVTGVVPEFFLRDKSVHDGLSERILVKTMHERKEKMMALADGMIALPGGFGTFEEILEALTWAQLHLHKKPCGLLNVAGYYDHLLAFLDHAAERGFLRGAHRELLLVAADPRELAEKMFSVSSV